MSAALHEHTEYRRAIETERLQTESGWRAEVDEHRTARSRLETKIVDLEKKLKSLKSASSNPNSPQQELRSAKGDDAEVTKLQLLLSEALARADGLEVHLTAKEDSWLAEVAALKSQLSRLEESEQEHLRAMEKLKGALKAPSSVQSPPAKTASSTAHTVSTEMFEKMKASYENKLLGKAASAKWMVC